MGPAACIRPDALGRSAPVLPRVRRLLARGARLADGQGAGHVGLPHLLPPALRLDAAVRAASGLPHAAHADRRRPPARSRRNRPAGGRLRCSLRRRHRRLERDSASVRPRPGSLRGRAAARLPGLRDALPPGVERCCVRSRSGRLGAGSRTRARCADDRTVRGRRCGLRSARAHTAREPGAPRPARARGAPRPGRLAPSTRARCRLPRCGPAAARRVGRAQRDPVRRHDRRSRREGVGAVPPRVPRRSHHLTRERRRVAAPGRAHRAGGPRTRATPRAGRHARRVPPERLELRDRALDRPLGPRAGLGRGLPGHVRICARGHPQGSADVRSRRRRHVLAVPPAATTPRGRCPA